MCHQEPYQVATSATIWTSLKWLMEQSSQNQERLVLVQVRGVSWPSFSGAPFQEIFMIVARYKVHAVWRSKIWSIHHATCSEASRFGLLGYKRHVSSGALSGCNLCYHLNKFGDMGDGAVNPEPREISLDSVNLDGLPRFQASIMQPVQKVLGSVC